MKKAVPAKSVSTASSTCLTPRSLPSSHSLLVRGRLPLSTCLLPGELLPHPSRLSRHVRRECCNHLVTSAQEHLVTQLGVRQRCQEGRSSHLLALRGVGSTLDVGAALPLLLLYLFEYVWRQYGKHGSVKVRRKD